MNSYAKFGSFARRRYYAIREKPIGDTHVPPTAVRGSTVGKKLELRCCIRLSTTDVLCYKSHCLIRPSRGGAFCLLQLEQWARKAPALATRIATRRCSRFSVWGTNVLALPQRSENVSVALLLIVVFHHSVFFFTPEQSI